MAIAHRRRRWLTGANSLLMGGLSLALVGALVVLADAERWILYASPLTSGSVNEDLKQVFEKAGGRLIKIHAFSAQKRDRFAALRDRTLRDRLQWMSAFPNVEVSFVDLDADPDTARALGVSAYGTVVIQANGERVDLSERALFQTTEAGLEYIGDPALARAVARTLADRPTVVYLLTGHGERTFSGIGLSSMRTWAEILGRRGVDIQSLDLVTQGPSVPKDADAVWVVGPTAPLSPGEDEGLRAYLEEGGRMVLLVEPDGTVPSFLEGVGITVPTGRVSDELQFFPHADRPVLENRPHAVWTRVPTDVRTMVSGAGALSNVGGRDTLVEPILGTRTAGWLNTDNQPGFDKSIDRPGPWEVMVSARWTRQKRESRLIVAADADLFSDDLLAEGPGNALLLDGIVEWLSDDPPPRPSDESRVPLHPLALSNANLSRLKLFFLGIWPLIPALVGFYVGWRRR